MKSPDKSFFDQLHNSIEEILDDEQLSIGRVGHPYTVPINYFKQLKYEILKTVNKSEIKAGKMLPLSRFKIWYGAAASLLVLSFLGAFLLNTSPKTTLLQELSEDEILAYLDSEPISYAELTNAAEFTEEEIFSITADNLPLSDDFELFIDSPEILLEEIEHLNEK